MLGSCWSYFFFFFFFQAEDGIRDKLVTGVQTCALPISPDSHTGHVLAGRLMLRPPRALPPRARSRRRRPGRPPAWPADPQRRPRGSGAPPRRASRPPPTPAADPRGVWNTPPPSWPGPPFFLG